MKFFSLLWEYLRKSPWYMWVLRFAIAYLIFVKLIIPHLKGGP